MVVRPDDGLFYDYSLALQRVCTPIRGLVVGLLMGYLATWAQAYAPVPLMLSVAGSGLARYFSAKLCHFFPRAQQNQLDAMQARACQVLFYSTCACYGMAIHPVLAFARSGSLPVVALLMELTLFLQRVRSWVGPIRRRISVFGVVTLAAFGLVDLMVRYWLPLPYPLLDVIVCYLILLWLSQSTVGSSLQIFDQNLMFDPHVAALHVLEGRCGALQNKHDQ